MHDQQPPSREQRRPDAVTAARARENRAFVRALLARNQPEFARVLTAAVAELSRELTDCPPARERE
ncbi:MAG TPA: hypothetical protein VHF26_14155 [Trebonia sp.]|jgi:hypothetical protein|nr:hypothetical protein [Trebonia sp.]